MAKSVLIVDDDLDIQSSLGFALRDEGYEVLTATLPREAEKILAERNIDIGLFDVWFPEGDGIDLLKATRMAHPKTSVVMMSGHGNIELALKAVRLGAYDFLEKPLELEKVLLVLRNAAEAQSLRSENKRLSEVLLGDAEFIGESPSTADLRESIRRAADAHSHVLIFGENGAGKELVAHILHRSSGRSAEPFVAINCAAIPETLIESELFGHEKGSFTGATERRMGRFEQAGKGTLFLDEISELSAGAQAKFLRILEERKFERVGGRSTIRTEARILAATNKDLQEEVKRGNFREDLFYRLNVLSIRVPALRERNEDIASLARHFVRIQSAEHRRKTPELSPTLLDWMRQYDWPGNVREMRNLLERMLIMGAREDLLDVVDLPDELQDFSALPSTGAFTELSDLDGDLRHLRVQFEKSIIEGRLKKNSGNVTRTAESLGIERAHLHRKMKQYGIQN